MPKVPAGLYAFLAAIAIIVVAHPVAETGACARERENARVETIFYNARIYTMDSGMPEAQAIAVGRGRIIAVGGSDALISRAGATAKRIDLKGRTVLPGFIDAHAHFLGYAKNIVRLDLVGTRSFDEVLERVARRAAETAPEEWIRGRGWDQNDWPEDRYPHRSELDAVVPDNPVYLVRICGHAAVVNSAALRIANITRETPDPPGGAILRDEQGEPTGVLIDKAEELITEKIPPLGHEEKKRLLVEAAHRCLSVGLVGVHEMGISSETVSIYRELCEEETLPFRITAYYDYDATDLDSVLDEGPIRGYADDHFSLIGVKHYIDGSLGARSAALLEDYSDEPGNRGLLVVEQDELYRSIEKCHRKGFQVAVHAIGDRGNRVVLDAYEKLLAAHPREDARHRIEHAQVVSLTDVPRFAALGVIPSMQFTHCTSDMPWAGARLGENRLEGSYAWRYFLSAGCRIPGGSDFPVESINPLLGVYAAVTRRDLEGNPPGGWFPEQVLTREEAVRAFTIDAAYAVHEETSRGTLTEGKLADFVVLSDDIMSISPEAIPHIKVLATVLGGEIVYDKEGFTGKR